MGFRNRSETGGSASAAASAASGLQPLVTGASYRSRSIAKLRRMTCQRSEPGAKRLRWERAHRLLNEECSVESRLIELLVGVSWELSLRHVYSNDRIGSPRSASAR